METKYQVLIIGGGTAGIMVAAQLKKKRKELQIAIVEPATKHYYQPAWTLVGGGAYDFQKTIKPMSDLIPRGVTWIQDSAAGFIPEKQQLKLASGKVIGYDFLVVAPGLVNDFSLIEGLEDALEKKVVCSNYVDPNETWRQLQNFKGGHALFTQPTTPIKCGGAPQKIMYLAAEYFAKNGLKEITKITFASPGSVIFGVKVIADSLMKVIERHKIDFKPFHAPIKIDADQKIAYFKDVQVKDNACMLNKGGNEEHEPIDGIVAMPFDFMHLAPPQTAPRFVKNSTLANEAGWLNVNINSMQHKEFPTIFGLGDVAGLPTAKTGAAVRKQAPVVVDNILKMMNNQEASNHSYEGYSSCPLVTGYGKMILAEFNYKNEFIPDPKLKRMLISDSSKEHWRLWMFKKVMLPYLYWNKMMKGKNV